MRRIEAGELITTDGGKETDRELGTFLRGYETAVNTNDHQRLEALIDQGAFGWVETRGEVDKAGIVQALLDVLDSGHDAPAADPACWARGGR